MGYSIYGTIQQVSPRGVCDYHIDEAFIHPELFKQKLSGWMIYYNTLKPHHSLGLLTPHQYLFYLQKESCQRLKCP